MEFGRINRINDGNHNIFMSIEITDNYKEHKLHEFWEKNCSSCYSDMLETLKKYNIGATLENNPRDCDMDLMQQRSAHPEERYW